MIALVVFVSKGTSKKLDSVSNVETDANNVYQPQNAKLVQTKLILLEMVLANAQLVTLLQKLTTS